MGVQINIYHLLVFQVKILYWQAFHFSNFQTWLVFILVLCFQVRNQYFFSSIFKALFSSERLIALANPIFVRLYWQSRLLWVIILRFILKYLLFRFIPSMLQFMSLQELYLGIKFRKVMLLFARFFRWFHWIDHWSFW